MSVDELLEYGADTSTLNNDGEDAIASARRWMRYGTPEEKAVYSQNIEAIEFHRAVSLKGTLTQGIPQAHETDDSVEKKTRIM